VQYVISIIYAKSLLINCRINNVSCRTACIHLRSRVARPPPLFSFRFSRNPNTLRALLFVASARYASGHLTSAGRNFSLRRARSAANFIRTHFEIVSRNLFPFPPLLRIVSIVTTVSLALGIISLLLVYFLSLYHIILPSTRASEIFRREKKFLTKIEEIVPLLSFALIIGLPLSDEHECAFLAIRFTAVAAPTKRR